MLVVKTSSLGDVVHTLPAVTDAAANYGDIVIDWVVEEAFVDIPAMHPAVNRVIPVAIRRWRRRLLTERREISEFVRRLRQDRYDVVIDAQGLIKSALVCLLAKGRRAGLDRASAREPLASMAYAVKLSIPPGIHAVEKVRRLFAGALRYELPEAPADFGLRLKRLAPPDQKVMFLHGTTWESKEWPETHWIELARMIHAAGIGVVLPHGNERELARACRIAAAADGARVLPRSGIEALAQEMTHCLGVVTVDTGLGHLAAAIGVPLVALYGPTDPALTGPSGKNCTILADRHLPCIPCLSPACRYAGATPAGSPFPPCFSETTPLRVWAALRELVSANERVRR